jgi:hypothetical protein
MQIHRHHPMKISKILFILMYSFDLLAMVQNASFTVRKISLKFLTTFLNQLCELSIYKLLPPLGKEVKY